MIEGKTFQQTANQIGTHISTAFYWRHKVLNTLRALATDNLQDVVESDENFFLESNKCKNQVAKLGERKPRKSGVKDLKRE